MLWRRSTVGADALVTLWCLYGIQSTVYGHEWRPCMYAGVTPEVRIRFYADIYSVPCSTDRSSLEGRQKCEDPADSFPEDA